MSSSSKDVIYLRNLQLSAVVGLDAWGRAGKAQPVTISLRLQRDTSRAGVSDEVQDTFSYGQMSKEVTATIDTKSFPDFDAIVASIGSLSVTWAGQRLEFSVTLPKGLLRVEGGIDKNTVMQRFTANEWRVCSSQWTVRNIKAACIIGVNPHERLVKQAVNINLCLPDKAEVNGSNRSVASLESSSSLLEVAELRRLVSMVFEIVEATSFETLEALAAHICKGMFQNFSIPGITIAVEKPSALAFVEASGVEITRTRLEECN